jgi:hypothetical protein
MVGIKQRRGVDGIQEIDLAYKKKYKIKRLESQLKRLKGKTASGGLGSKKVYNTGRKR